MIVYYNLKTKEIVGTEDNTSKPLLPMNMSDDERVEFYIKDNTGIIYIEEEMGISIWNYKLCFNESGVFTGIESNK